MLIESCTAAEECEVIRTYSGRAIVCPMIQETAADGSSAASFPFSAERLASVIRVGRTIVDGTPGLSSLVQEDPKSIAVQARAGVSHGLCVGGLVGKVKGFFDLVGPPVNAAIDLANGCAPGDIAVDPRIRLFEE